MYPIKSPLKSSVNWQFPTKLFKRWKKESMVACTKPHLQDQAVLADLSPTLVLLSASKAMNEQEVTISEHGVQQVSKSNPVLVTFSRQ